MDFATVIEERYSCKSYDGSAPAREQIAAVLEAARRAPTAKNLQEQHIYVCQSPEALAKIDEITPCRYNAPCVLVVAFDATNVFTYPGGARFGHRGRLDRLHPPGVGRAERGTAELLGQPLRSGRSQARLGPAGKRRGPRPGRYGLRIRKGPPATQPLQPQGAFRNGHVSVSPAPLARRAPAISNACRLSNGGRAQKGQRNGLASRCPFTYPASAMA